VDLYEPEAIANFAAPTTAELNNAALSFNITCALWEDDTEFTLGDPDTDDGLTFCTLAGTQTPTFLNPTVTLSILRDKDRTAAGIFDGALQRLMFADCNYLAVLRVGKASDVVYAVGDKIKMVDVKTDQPQDVVGATDNARLTNATLPNGRTNWNYSLAS